jgi:hypothetical protein
MIYENNGAQMDPVSEAISGVLKGQTEVELQDAISEEPFSYEGYQVVRGEFFAHMFEPSVTFNNCKVSLNTACLKRLPTVEYIQFLVNPTERKMAVRPCGEEEKDAFRWCVVSHEKRKPRQITCPLFFAKIANLMGWNPQYRYKLLGKTIQSGDEQLVLFDLSATETYQRIIREGDKPRTSRKPIFPAEWQNQFGLPVEEHRKLLQVNIFNGYTVFGLEENAEPVKQPEEQIAGGVEHV